MGTFPAMNSVRSLLARGLQGPSVSDDTWNPLREEDQLKEAVLIDVLFDITALTVGVLFDLGNALQLRDGAVGLLVVRGAYDLKWEAERLSDTFFVWTVLSSTPVIADGSFRMRMGSYPDAELTVAGRSAEFYEFDVSGGEAFDDPTRNVVGQHPEWVRPTWSQNYEMRNYWVRSAGTAR